MDADDAWLVEIQRVWFLPRAYVCVFFLLQPGKLSDAVRGDALEQQAAYIHAHRQPRQTLTHSGMTSQHRLAQPVVRLTEGHFSLHSREYTSATCQGLTGIQSTSHVNKFRE